MWIQGQNWLVSPFIYHVKIIPLSKNDNFVSLIMTCWTVLSRINPRYLYSIRFSKLIQDPPNKRNQTTRYFLLQLGSLNWTHINTELRTRVHMTGSFILCTKAPLAWSYFDDCSQTNIEIACGTTILICITVTTSFSYSPNKLNFHVKIFLLMSCMVCLTPHIGFSTLCFSSISHAPYIRLASDLIW